MVSKEDDPGKYDCAGIVRYFTYGHCASDGRTKKEKTDSTQSVLMDTEHAMMNTDQITEGREQEEALEHSLEQFLSCMEGVGRVRVMLTFSATEEYVVEKDAPSSVSSDTREKDSAGGSRSVTERESREDTVFTTDAAGRQVPYVKKTLAAPVEGVTVLAEGADSGTVRKKITDMIEALFDIEAHKIIVAKLAGTAENQSGAVSDRIYEESRGSRN